MHAATTVWQLLPGQALHHRVWDDECVLFNDLTGATHLLDPNALDVLLALRAGAAAVAQLCQRLSIDPTDLDAVGGLDDTLTALAAIALVESAAC